MRTGRLIPSQVSRPHNDVMDGMDRLILELRLAEAQEDVMSSARLINEQRNRVAALKRIGRRCHPFDVFGEEDPVRIILRGGR